MWDEVDNDMMLVPSLQAFPCQLNCVNHSPCNPYVLNSFCSFFGTVDSSFHRINYFIKHYGSHPGSDKAWVARRTELFATNAGETRI